MWESTRAPTPEIESPRRALKIRLKPQSLGNIGPAGRNDRPSDGHRHGHLFRQDRPSRRTGETVSRFQRALPRIGNFLILVTVGLVIVVAHKDRRVQSR